MKISELTDKLFEAYQNGDATDTDLVQIIELASIFLNLKTLTNTAKMNGKSYNGVKRFTQCDLIIDNVKFYINNE
mgnify:CR=1 FL=1